MIGIWLDDQDLIDKLVQRFGNDESAQFRKDTYSLIVALWYDDLLFYYVPITEEEEPHIQIVTQKSVSSDPATVSFYVRPFNKMMTKDKVAHPDDGEDAFVTKCLLALKDEAMMKEVNSALMSGSHKDLCLKPKASKWNKYKFQYSSYEEWMKTIIKAYIKD